MTKQRTILRVTLTEHELEVARRAGMLRQQRADARGVSRDLFSFCDNTTEGHIMGVEGEIALGKALNLPWCETPYVKGEKDLPNGVEARCRSAHWHQLFINPKDDDSLLYFLVTKAPGDPVYQVHGWIFAHEAKRSAWYTKLTPQNPPSFFVPPEYLHSIEEYYELSSKTEELS